MVEWVSSFTAKDLIFLLKAMLVTLQLFGSALGLGLIVGFFAGIMRTYPRSVVVRKLASFYIEFFRSTPIMLQVIVFYFGISLFGRELSRGVVAAAGLSLYAGAYLGEILRAGIESVDRRQWQAAASLGMSYPQIMRGVILPQVVRICIPPSINFLVSLAKATSLVSVSGYIELTRAGRLIVERTYQPFLVWGIVMAIYFLICYPITIGGRRLEMRFQRKEVR